MQMPDPEFCRIYGIPANIDREKVMTGQIMFRKSSDTPAPGDGTDRELMIIIGVVAVPKNSPLKDHLQYPVLGEFEQSMFEDLTIHLSIHEAFDPKIPVGEAIGGLIRAPIWRT